MLNIENLPMVAKASMNQTHYEEVEQINTIIALLKSEKLDDVGVKLDALVKHTQEHFEGEEKMMQSSNFPPFPFHKGEHDKALSELLSMQKMWEETKNVEKLLYYFDTTVPQWLLNHIQTMDAMTAVFLETGVSPCSIG